MNPTPVIIKVIIEDIGSITNPTLIIKFPIGIQSKRNIEASLSCGLWDKKLKNTNKETRNDNNIAVEAIQPDNDSFFPFPNNRRFANKPKSGKKSIRRINLLIL